MDTKNMLTCYVCNSLKKVTVTSTAVCCVNCRGFFLTYMKKPRKWEQCNSGCGVCTFCRLKKCLSIGLKFTEGQRKYYKPRKYSEEEVNDILINGNVEIARVTEREDRGQPCSICQRPRSPDARGDEYQSHGSCNLCAYFFRRYQHRQLPVCDKQCMTSPTMKCYYCRRQRCLAVGFRQRQHPKSSCKRRRSRKIDQGIPAKKRRFTSPNSSYADSSSDEEREKKCEIDIDSDFKKRRLSIAAVIAEKEHKLMVS